ncbi:flagellar motor protein MotB [Arthrobacter sp. I2-34]|uniref:Flagellar motor protein MotB n=1 Tax=Arthrobacter hankyongi TaxID=2904801 RepID=A0ABS9L4Q1_9MICC|nr:flagellar motor protein MotB [Arthrobacter hankyongi]MCG2621662.1 flagellar motor protein MotB [Arthrobacter hankyongi]
MSRSRRRRSGYEEEEHPDERWMASYMDMVTVLMCMFIVLFAMSTVDANKFAKLANSLATGFGSVQSQKVDTAEGVVVPPELANAQGEGFADMEVALWEVEDLTALQDKIATGLHAQGLEDAARFELDERGLTIRLVGSESFFRPDDAALTARTTRVLNVVGPVLKPVHYELKVEGHTAQVRDFDPRATDWELSSDRAVNVLRHLVENSGVAMSHISAVGFGESRPLKTSGSKADLAANRRVDIVVLSGQPETVRALIPEVAKDPAAALRKIQQTRAKQAASAETGSAQPAGEGSQEESAGH